MNHDELIDQLTFEYHGICAANPDWHVSLYDFLTQRGIPERYISVDSEESLEKWARRMNKPHPADMSWRDGIEALQKADEWLDGFMGKCLDGADIAYLYAYAPEAEAKLREYGIRFMFYDRDGNELEGGTW